MKIRQIGLLGTAIGALLCTGVAVAAIEENGEGMSVITSVRHDTSPPLAELIRIVQDRQALEPDPVEPPDYVYPNFTEVEDSATKADQTLVGDTPEGVQRTVSGASTPGPILSFDAIGQADAPGGGLPPDTNGDVGPDHYIAYINTDWAIYDKTTGNLIGSVLEGNTFWAGFGGVCESSNSGDPVVLYDKLADRWVFTQFTGSATNRQCFAVTTTGDPTGPYNRYEFDFSPVFNDYPHLSIWTDASGARSGYYLTTHDFSDVGGPNQAFEQNSFSVVERDAMLTGAPARIVRFTETAFQGVSAFGALSAHLESTELPPAGMCAPFVHNRADLDGYLLWELCVDWTNVANSTLSSPFVVPAGVDLDNNVNRIPQPAPAPAGAELDEFAGNTMFRASARAYPAASGLPVELVINHVSNAGGGRAGVRWIHFSLPDADDLFAGGFETSEPLPQGAPRIVNQGLYAPGDDYRWMAGISIDQNRNIGVGYSVSSDTTFPSVRYAARSPADPPGELRPEASCVVGGGVQTFVDASGRASRWGDYSSMSIDPDDQCTFWLQAEYYAVTGTASWDNRVCSFVMPDCGTPTYAIRSNFNRDIKACALNDAPQADIEALSLGGFSSTLTLSAVNLPAGVTVNFDNGTINSYPGSSNFTVEGLGAFGDGDFNFQINTDAAVGIDQSLDFNVQVSSSVLSAPNLTTPSNTAETSVRPTLSWTALPGALDYVVEVALDAGFTNIIESATVPGNSYTVSSTLAENTTYFWRVTAENNCGPGATSNAFSFTTIPPGQCPAGTSPNVVFNDNLETGAAGWTQPPDPVGSGNTWALSDVRQNSGTFSFLAVDVATTSDQYLVSPAINVPPIGQQPITLSFWNFQNLEANAGTGEEACWDGGLLEVSTDGGSTFTQVPDSRLLTDPYNGNITINNASPISGLFAWCADDIQPASGDQETTSIVDLSEFAGQTIRLRFRVGTDGAAADEGWYIDDVQVQGCN
ncbi:MAG: hypothetical protein Tsb002_33420 [Wenzhouxiangellaceae bacterium]